MDSLGQILIVEDNPDDYESILRSFKKVNLLNPVHWSPSGQDAIDYLTGAGKYNRDTARLMPVLILLDLNMPGLDGRGVLQITKATPDIRRIPVVVLTTSADPIDIEKCYDIGANSYIQKPVGFDNLVEAAKRVQGFWFGVALLPNPTRHKDDGTFETED